MDAWEKHELRLRRQKELQDFSDWLLAHPWWARGISLWLALAITLLGVFLAHIFA